MHRSIYFSHWGLVCKDKTCCQGKQILSFKSNAEFEGIPLALLK